MVDNRDFYYCWYVYLLLVLFQIKDSFQGYGDVVPQTYCGQGKHISCLKKKLKINH